MFFFFFNDTATTEIYTLSLHDALPIFNYQTGETVVLIRRHKRRREIAELLEALLEKHPTGTVYVAWDNSNTHEDDEVRSEEHTSELQSRQYLVCRLLLEKKKKNKTCKCHVGYTTTSS